MLPIVALLALAVVVVIVLLRVMKARHAAGDRQAAAPQADEPAAPVAPLTREEQEYLDSSHILPGGRDALDTRADAWRDNKRK
jgi:hypothetical protein